MIAITFLLKFQAILMFWLIEQFLYNCRIEAEDNFLLELRAACPCKKSDLNMYFTVNTVFMHYFESLTNNLETHILQNWTMHEQVLPILIQTFVCDSKLLEAPKTLKHFVYQYQQKKQVLDKRENNVNSKHSFFDNYIMDVFLFTAPILSMIATAAIVHIMCKHAKLKALLTGIACQPLRETDAIFGSNNEKEHCSCDILWYTIVVLASVIIGLILFVLVTTSRCRIFREKLFSNTVSVMLYFSDVNQYAPV